MTQKPMRHITLHVGAQRLTLKNPGEPPQVISYEAVRSATQRLSPATIIRLILSPLTYLNIQGKETLFLSDAQQTFLHYLSEKSFLLQGLGLYQPLKPSTQDWQNHIYEYWDETRAVWVVGPGFSGLRQLNCDHLEKSLAQFQNYLRRYGYRITSSDTRTPQRIVTPEEALEHQAPRHLLSLTIPEFFMPQAKSFRQWFMLTHGLMLGIIFTLKAIGWYGSHYFQQQHMIRQHTTQHSQSQEHAGMQAQQALEAFMAHRTPPDFSILRQFINDFYGDGVIQSLEVTSHHIAATIALNPESGLNKDDMIAWATLYSRVVIDHMEDTLLKLRIMREEYE